MNMEREQNWLSIITMSEKMHELAQQLQWEDLASLENKRQELIRTFFTDPVLVEDADTIRAGIHQILSMDKQIISLSKKHRESLGKELINFRTNKKAVSAYKVNSR